jgi:predicted RNA-binding protein YlqC (UPF0109 family)
MAHKLVEYIVKSLVSKPEVVSVSEVDVQGKHILQIRVSSHDIAKVIGGGGRTFRALRTVVSPVLPSEIKDIVVDIAA